MVTAGRQAGVGRRRARVSGARGAIRVPRTAGRLARNAVRCGSPVLGEVPSARLTKQTLVPFFCLPERTGINQTDGSHFTVWAIQTTVPRTFGDMQCCVHYASVKLGSHKK